VSVGVNTKPSTLCFKLEYKVEDKKKLESVCVGCTLNHHQSCLFMSMALYGVRGPNSILELELVRRLRPSWAMFVARCASSDVVLSCARGGTKSLMIAGRVIKGGEGLPVFVQPVFEGIN
jgi:hypothetical protein